MKKHLDNVGIAASTACAIHCAILPFLLIFLPVLGTANFLFDETFHWIFISLTIALGFTGISIGYREHRNWKVFFILLASAMFFLWSLFSGDHEHHHEHPEIEISLALGGIFMVIAHVVNKMLCKKCCRCH